MGKHIRPSLPIILGGEDRANKCIIGVAAKGRAKLAIYRLKDSANVAPGTAELANEDIAGVVQELWFADRKSLQSMIHVLQELDVLLETEEKREKSK